MTHQVRTSLILSLATIALLQGCSSGSGDGGVAPPPIALAPSLAGLADQSFDQDSSPPPQAFKIEDADTPVAQLELAIATSDPNLLPLRGVQVEGSGNDRTLRLSPAAESTGTATLTFTVRDPTGLTATRTINVRVNPVLVSFSTVAKTAFDTDRAGTAAKVSGVTIQPDADDDPAAFDALLQSGSP